MKMKNCVKQKPTSPGKYNVKITGVFTLLPIFMEFDGENWKWEQLTLLSVFNCKEEDVFYFD